MRCDRCDKPMKPEESEAHMIPGATGPGITVRVHRERCEIPPTRPRSYPTQ